MTSPLTDEQLKDMLAGCSGVTPGPWQREEPSEWSSVTETRVGAPGDTLATLRWARNTSGNAHRDASHIARGDPQTISSLITELLELRAERGKE